MARPTKILPREILARWKREAIRRKNEDGLILVDDWAERRLLDVINSHQALRDATTVPMPSRAAPWKGKTDG